jgi:hypothetical protein
MRKFKVGDLVRLKKSSIDPLYLDQPTVGVIIKLFRAGEPGPAARIDFFGQIDLWYLPAIELVNDPNEKI